MTTNQHGATIRTRTGDLSITSGLLYQLSYGGERNIDFVLGKLLELIFFTKN
jgi:hypothetical protein